MLSAVKDQSKLLLAVLALICFVSNSFAGGDSRFTYFDRAAKSLERLGDVAGAALMRELGGGGPIVPRILSESATASNPSLAARYGALQKDLKRLIVGRGYAPENAWRIYRAEAALVFVAYELEQLADASERDVMTYLSDAKWILGGMTRGAPPAAAVVSEPETAVVETPIAGPPPRLDPVPAPRVSLMLSKSHVAFGEATWLKWNAQNAKTVDLDGERVDSIGHRLIYPTENRRYQIVARADSGIASAVTELTVFLPPPPVERPSANALPDRFTISSTTLPPDTPAMVMIERLVEALRQTPSMRVRVETHTDPRGSAAANLKLSRQRAAQLRDFIVRKYGIAARRFDVVGKGESTQGGHTFTSLHEP